MKKKSYLPRKLFNQLSEKKFSYKLFMIVGAELVNAAEPSLRHMKIKDLRLVQNINDDLGLSSLDKLVLYLKLETKIEVTFFPDEVSEIRTVGDIMAYLAKYHAKLR